jgi:hypothetical protein
MRLVRLLVTAGLAVLAIALAIALLPGLYVVVDRSLASGYIRAESLVAFGAAAQGVAVILIGAATAVLLALLREVRRSGEAQAKASQRLRWEEQVRATPILRVTFSGWESVGGKVVAVFEIENPSPQPVLETTLVVRGREDRRAAPSTHSAQTSIAMVPNLGSSKATLDLSDFRTTKSTSGDAKATAGDAKATAGDAKATAGDAKAAADDAKGDRDIFTYPWLQVMVEYRAILGQRVQEEYSVWIDRPVEATEIWHFEHLRVEPTVEGFAPLDIAF